MSHSNHPMYAVLIAIGDYANAPKLEGPPNDLALMATLCDRLGIDEGRRRVVAAPLGAGATLADIEQALDWLANKLDDPNATALLHFSGHGTLFNEPGYSESLALAASDFVPTGTGTAAERGVVTLVDLAKRFNVPGVPVNPDGRPLEQQVESYLVALKQTKLARLTVTLDCCWNDLGIGSDASVTMPLLEYRILVGCSRFDVANEIVVDGERYGAFTWALTTALSRWTVTDFAGNPQMTVTHGELMRRVSQLLGVLDVKDQRPMLAGPRELDLIPVFQRALSWDAGAPASPVPDVIDPGRQLWAGDDERLYIIEWQKPGGDFSPVGTILANVATQQEVWTLFKDSAYEWIEYTETQGDPGHLKFVHSATLPSEGTVSWSWARNTTPSGLSETEISGKQLYEHTKDTTRIVVRFSVKTESSGEYSVQGVEWWCTDDALKMSGGTQSLDLWENTGPFKGVSSTTVGGTGMKGFAPQKPSKPVVIKSSK